MTIQRHHESLMLSLLAFLSLAASSLMPLEGPTRLIGPALYLLTGSSALVSLFFGNLIDRAISAIIAVLLLAASYYTLGIGESALFVLASGVWLYGGVPLTLILYFIARARVRASAHNV